MSSYFGRPDYVHAADQEHEQARIREQRRVDQVMRETRRVRAETWHQVPFVCTTTQVRFATPADYVWLGLTHTQEDMSCSRCGKRVTNVKGTLWHTGDPFHQLTDHTPVVEDHAQED